MFFHLSSHSSTSVHYTERKLKNKKQGSPGNVHHEFSVMRVITPISTMLSHRPDSHVGSESLVCETKYYACVWNWVWSLLTSFPGSCVWGEARQPTGLNIPTDLWNYRLEHWGIQIFQYSASGLEGELFWVGSNFFGTALGRGGGSKVVEPHEDPLISEVRCDLVAVTAIKRELVLLLNLLLPSGVCLFL